MPALERPRPRLARRPARLAHGAHRRAALRRALGEERQQRVLPVLVFRGRGDERAGFVPAGRPGAGQGDAVSDGGTVVAGHVAARGVGGHGSRVREAAVEQPLTLTQQVTVNAAGRLHGRQAPRLRPAGHRLRVDLEHLGDLGGGEQFLRSRREVVSSIPVSPLLR